MFSLGDTVVWTTEWGTKYLGTITARFTDHTGVECICARFLDPNLTHLQFVAAVFSCKLFVGTPPQPRLIECGGMQPGEEDRWEIGKKD